MKPCELCAAYQRGEREDFQLSRITVEGENYGPYGPIHICDRADGATSCPCGCDRRPTTVDPLQIAT